MPARKPPPPDQRPQIEEFIETARKLGADESREAFERAFEKMVKIPSIRRSCASVPTSWRWHKAISWPLPRHESSSVKFHFKKLLGEVHHQEGHRFR